jgi:hypothetical protein
MKLFDTILFSFAILFLMIGIHQAMTVSYMASYWLFMLALGTLLWFQYRKKNRGKEENIKNPEKEKKSNKPVEKISKKRKYKI